MFPSNIGMEGNCHYDDFNHGVVLAPDELAFIFLNLLVFLHKNTVGGNTFLL